MTVWAGDIVCRERTVRDGFIIPTGRSQPRTVGNGYRGFGILGDGWVGSTLSRDWAKGACGSVTSVCWDWKK